MVTSTPLGALDMIPAERFFDVSLSLCSVVTCPSGGANQKLDSSLTPSCLQTFKRLVTCNCIFSFD